MASDGVMQAWDELDNKVKSKLGQLTGLLQHFTASTDSDSDVYYQNLASQHDTEIEEILRETVDRVHVFKEALVYQVQEDKIKAATEAVRLAADNELLAEKKKAKERQEALEASCCQKLEFFHRDMMMLKQTLEKEIHELEAALSRISQLSQELEEEKMFHEEEIAKQLIISTDQIEKLMEEHKAELRACANHEKEELKKQEASHEDLMEQMRTYYKDEITRLKNESEERMNKMQESYNALQYELTTEKMSLQSRLTIVYKEREALAKETAILKGSLREANCAIENNHTQIEQTKSSLEEDIEVLKEDNRHLEERLRSALHEISRLSEDADVEKSASAATLGQLEDTIRRLKWELEKMTANSKKKEEVINNDSFKIEQLQASLSKTERELDIATAEVEKEKYNLAVKADQIQDLESRKRALAGEITQLRSTIAEKDEVIGAFELKLQVQTTEHDLKYKTLEEDFVRTRAETKEKHKNDVKAFQTKLREQQAKHISQLNIYQARVDHLEAEIGMLKSHGEDELKLLNSQVTGHEDEFKRVCSCYERKLEDSEKKCLELENSVEVLNESMKSLEKDKQTEIESLQRTIAQAFLAQQQLETDAQLRYTAKLEEQEKQWLRKVEQEQECAEVAIQKLNEMHATAIEVAMYNHQMECAMLKNGFEQQKTQVTQSAKEEWLKEIEKLRTQLRDEHEKWRLEREGLLSLAAQEHSAIVTAHENALEAHRKKSETEIAHLKEQHAREMSVAVSRASEKAVLESLSIHEDHKKMVERLTELHNVEMQKLRDNHAKEIDKHKCNAFQSVLRISDLENAIAAKEKKLSELSDANRELETKNEAFIKELKLNHEKAFNFQRSKFCKDKEILAKQLERKYRTELDSCNVFHSQQYQTLQQDLNRSKGLMRQKQAELTNLRSEIDILKVRREQCLRGRNDSPRQVSELQDRFEKRESRPEDLRRIADLEQLCLRLQEACDSKDFAYNKLQGESKQIRMEMLNREENYNKIFRSSPVVQTASIELKPRSPSRSAQGSRAESRQGNR